MAWLETRVHGSSPVAGHPLLIPEQVLHRLRQAGRAHGVDSDPDIVTFLLDFFEAPSGRTMMPNVCSLCRSPLTLVCLTCNSSHTQHGSSTTKNATIHVNSTYNNNNHGGDHFGNVPLTVDKLEAVQKSDSLMDQSLLEKDIATKPHFIYGGGKLCEDNTYGFSDGHCDTYKPCEEDCESEKDVPQTMPTKMFQGIVPAETSFEDISNKEKGPLSTGGLKKMITPVMKDKPDPSVMKDIADRQSDSNRLGIKRSRSRNKQTTLYKESKFVNKCKKEVNGKRKRGRPRKDAVSKQGGKQEIHTSAVCEKGQENENDYKCSLRPKAFESVSKRDINEKIHREEGEKHHKCEHCSATFRSAANLRTHCRKHTGERPFSCETCGKCFARSTTLRQHRRVHTDERPYRCQQCDQAFRQRGLLAVHRRKAHTQERPFACSLCPATFVVKGHLSSHLLSHTGLRPFLCEQCGAAFRTKGTLKLHRMIHTSLRPFTCDLCPKAFYRQVDVRLHRKTHFNVRNAVCSVCGSAFGNNSTLKRHMQTHTGYRPFKCSKCDKNFASSSDLKVHQRIHTGHKPYVCDVCDRGFQTMGNMKKHRNNRHKDALPYVAPSSKAGPTAHATVIACEDKSKPSSMQVPKLHSRMQQ